MAKREITKKHVWVKIRVKSKRFFFVKDDNQIEGQNSLENNFILSIVRYLEQTF